MNKITLIGNLTHDPEVRSTQTGKNVCTFTIAVNRKKVSEPQTDFFRINAWNGLSDTCARFLNKGKKVAVVGELQARTYEDRQGKTRLSLDVVADEVEFLSPKDSDTATVSNGKVKEEPALDGFTDIRSDDLPF